VFFGLYILLVRIQTKYCSENLLFAFRIIRHILRIFGPLDGKFRLSVTVPKTDEFHVLNVVVSRARLELAEIAYFKLQPSTAALAIGRLDIISNTR
jgi:hypothetical protein